VRSTNSCQTMRTTIRLHLFKSPKAEDADLTIRPTVDTSAALLLSVTTMFHFALNDTARYFLIFGIACQPTHCTYRADNCSGRVI
jgi:hypothetical protein